LQHRRGRKYPRPNPAQNERGESREVAAARGRTGRLTDVRFPGGSEEVEQREEASTSGKGKSGLGCSSTDLRRAGGHWPSIEGGRVVGRRLDDEATATAGGDRSREMGARKWAEGDADELAPVFFEFPRIIQTDFKCLNSKIENDTFMASKNYGKFIIDTLDEVKQLFTLVKLPIRHKL
jgi:hypothetical protein